MYFFFTFDQILHRIRPLVPLDSPTFPQLSERLLQDLQGRKVSLNENTWSLVLADSETPGSIDDKPFIRSFIKSRLYH
jgi:hypothetical protein